MEALHQIEILWILFLQSFTAWLAEPMRLISLFGQEDFYMLVMPALYWCFDATIGIRVGMMLLLTHSVNTAAKMVFHQPRPYWINHQVHAYAAETSFGLPSGHAQMAISIWGLLAALLQNKRTKIALAILIFLIGFSRIILGVHFISDVVAGWLIGALLLFLFVRFEKPITAWVKTLPLAQMAALALGSTLLLSGGILVAGASSSQWVLPSEWTQLAAAARPETTIDPLSISDAFTIGGTWLGLLLGAAWLYHRQGGFHADGTPSQRLLRYFIGTAGILALWYGLGQVFPREPDAISYGLRFFRYTLVGLWVSAGAPLVFQRFGLVRQTN